MQQKVPLMEQILYIQLLKANPKSNLTNLKYYVNARRSEKVIEIKKVHRITMHWNLTKLLKDETVTFQSIEKSWRPTNV